MAIGTDPGLRYPQPIDEAKLRALFPAARPRLAENVFELGLVLGGTVSAGAYTAGVLDFLVQALDAWQRRKDENSAEAPRHRVVISTLAGASGGAVNAAILGRMAGYESGTGAASPFYKAWVGSVGLKDLLAPEEDPRNRLVAALNTHRLETIAGDVIAYAAAPVTRPYLADPIRIFLTLGNITGIPYRISLSGESGLSHAMLSHADYARFRVRVAGGLPDPNAPDRPDEIALEHPLEGNVEPRLQQEWERLKDAALATCAFPLAFRARPYRRLIDLCQYRVTTIFDATGKPEVRPVVPDWPEIPKADQPGAFYEFVNVDGGTFNNEPFDLARTALAGYEASNPRGGLEAHRAVILVDPFSAAEPLGPAAPPDALGLVWPLVDALIRQARYKPEDIALANAENVYSRYIVTPVHPDRSRAGKPIVGPAAIAGGALGGFGGFLAAAFTEHDYLLGRRNAWKFLRDHLALPEAHPLFASPAWTDAQRIRHRIAGPTGPHLPLIPLMPELRDAPPPLKPWPVDAVHGEDFGDAIAQKLQEKYDALKDRATEGSRLLKILFATVGWAVWRGYLRGALGDAIVSRVDYGLAEHELRSKP